MTEYRIIKADEIDGCPAWLVRAMPGDTVGVVVRERPRKYTAIRYHKTYGSAASLKGAAAILEAADQKEPWR